MSERDIFTAARAMTDPAARSAYLDGACGADSGLRARVEALLRAHDQPDSLLDHPAVAAPEADPGATEALNGTPDPVMTATRTTAGENGASDDEALAFLSPATRPDSLGRIGHYEVLQVLGKGGFGIVFRAFDETLQRVVALKVMAPQLAATSPARKRFLREARSSAQVRHENMVQVYEVAEQPLPYLAMEFIPGETLQQRLDRVGPVEPAEVVRIGRQIAEGLAAAHAMDLIHRDIKPGNVLLEGGQQKVKITDFGLARAADDASISQSGIIAGTPMYMAPEQAKGETLDQRADLFSLGSVLYQMASGRPPFRANTTVAVLKRVAEDAPRPIREIIPETPQWLCDIIAKLHAKDPADRYQSAREVADVLADCEAQLKNHSRLKDYSRIPRNKPQRSGRGKWAAVAAAVVLLPVIALAATEFAGVTHLLRLGPPKRGADQPGPAADASFDAKQAQESSAKQWGVPVETTNSIGMKLRLIPAGKFMMGSSKEEIDFWLKQKHDGWYKDLLLSERPQHEVEITQPFYMGQTDVTVGQFRQFVKATGYMTQAEREGGAVRGFPNGGFNDVANTDWLNPGFAQTDDHPVVCVSWNDAVEFCQWLSKQEGKTYRLPTEAEWEYSCRAGSRGRWSFGDDEGELWDYARVGGNSQNHSWPVAGLKANAWGLYDMHGNVQQWCQDLFDPNYYKTSPPKDPPGPAAGDERVIRGGLWLWGADVSRSAMRNKTNPAGRANFCGFRVVLVVSPPAGVQSESGAKIGPAKSPAAAMPADAVLVMNFDKDTFFEKDGKTWVRDLSGRGNDGVCEGVSFTPGGKVGGGLACQGGALRIPHSLIDGQANYTITGWCRWDTIAGSDYCLYGSGVSEKEPLFVVSVPSERSIFVHAWNKDYDPPNYWLGALTKVGSVPEQGWYFFAVTLRDGGVGRGTLQVTVNETTFPLNSQMVSAHDGRMVYDVIGFQMSDAVIDELTVFQRALSDDEIRTLRELGQNNVPLSRADAAPPPPAVGPFTDADVQRIAALPAEQQVEEVRKELIKRNPGFDGKMDTKIEGGVVTELKIVTDHVTDISPIRVFDALRVLNCSGTWANFKPNGLLEDLTPLKGMKLAFLTHLHLGNTKVGDAGMVYFKDCKKLTQVYLNNTQVSDAGLANFRDCQNLKALDLTLTQATDAGMVYFKDCKDLSYFHLINTKVTNAGLANFKDCKDLTSLGLGGTQVGDAGLTHLKGMPLRSLSIDQTAVTDLTPLQSMALEEIHLTPKNITRGLDILRDMNSLKTIGIHWYQSWPAAEFWERYDKGEFKE